MNKSSLMSMVVLAALSLVAGWWPDAWAQPPVFSNTACHARLFDPLLIAANDSDGAFDLEWCQRECRMRYGLEPTGGGIGGHAQSGDSEGVWTNASEGSYSLYSSCLADCNRRFWSEFERKTGSTPGR